MGLCTAEESIAVEERLKSDAQFKKEYDLLCAIDTEAKNYSYTAVDGKGAWKKISSKLNKPSRPVQLNPNKNFTWMRVAAILVVLLTTAIVYRVNQSHTDIEILTIMADQHGEMFDLPDGSKVWLKKGSQLSYYEAEDKSSRKTTLEGVGFFVVKPNDNKNFEVATSHLKVVVLGTSFEVEQKTVEVLEGKVEVESKNSNEKVILGQHDAVQVSDQGEFSDYYISLAEDPFKWRTASLKFQDTPLRDILSRLEDHYQIKVIFDEEMLDNQYTFNFENLDLEEIIKLIEEVTSTKVKIANQEYRFKA